MLRHLKAAHFVNLIEGVELPAKHQTHIDGCSRCRATWESMRSVHAEITSMETDISEPDWTEFRSSVRDQLLSRSIQRESAVRRWTGWTIRPPVAWALSMLMAVGVTTVLWKIEGRSPAPTPAGVESTIPVEPAAEVIEYGPEKSLFDDVLSLGDEEQEQLRQMLESAQKGASYTK